MPKFLVTFFLLLGIVCLPLELLCAQDKEQVENLSLVIENAGVSYSNVRLEMKAVDSEGRSFQARLAEGVEEFVEITPPCESLSVNTWNNVISIGGNFVPSTCYALTIKPGLTAFSVGNAKVVTKEKITTAWISPDKSSQLSLASRGVVLPVHTPYWELPLRYRNLDDDKLKYSVSRVLPNVLLNVLEPTRVRDYSMKRWTEMVSSGELQLPRLALNQDGAAALDLKQIGIEKNKPGVYLVEIQGEAPRTNVMRWDSDCDDSFLLLLSDIAIFATADEKECLCTVRSIAHPEKAFVGADVSLYSNKHQLLAHRVTDGNGQVRLPLKTLKDDFPALILVSAPTENDVSYLDVRNLQMSNSRSASSMSAMVFAERNLYRPGECVTASAVLRNRVTGEALAGVPMRFNLLCEGEIIAKQDAVSTAFGCLQTSFTLDGDCKMGDYAIELTIPGDQEQIFGNTAFMVGNFTPEQIEVRLEASCSEKTADSCHLSGHAQYYFGTPLVKGKVDATVRGEWEDVLPPEHPLCRDGYHFGCKSAGKLRNGTYDVSRDVVKTEAFNLSLPAMTTDAEGNFEKDVAFMGRVRTVLAAPLGIYVSAYVKGESGMRPVCANAKTVRHLQTRYVGIKAFDDETLDAKMKFGVKAVSPELEPVALARGECFSYELKRLYWDYVTQQNGDVFRNVWENRCVTVDHGKIQVDKDGSFLLKMPSEGNFELLLCSGDAEEKMVLASVKFWYSAGESASHSPNPNEINFRLDGQKYAPGDEAVLSFECPFEGIAVVACGANAMPSEYMVVKLDEGENQLSVPIPSGLVGGSYHVQMTCVSALLPDGFKTADPQYCYGNAVLAVEQKKHELVVELTGPQKVASNDEAEYVIDLKNSAGDGVCGEVMLWGVDEGVLALTAFRTPDAFANFFGSKGSPFSSCSNYPDLYPLLRVVNGKIGGGLRMDAVNAMKANAMRERLRAGEKVTNAVQLGIVRTDEHGHAVAKVKFPDFNGAMRLMAVASGRVAAGSTELRVTVRDEVTVSMLAPQFMAPGDSTVVTVAVFNHEARSEKISYEWTVDGGDGKGKSLAGESGKVSLKKGKSSNVKCRIKVPADCPEGKLKARFTVRWDKKMCRSVEETIVVRRPAHTIPGSEWQMLQAGESREVALDGKMENEVLSVGTPALLLQQHLDWLNNYPYGCLEQTVSSAMPWLFLPLLVKQGVVPEKMLDGALSRIQSALRHIQSMKCSSQFSMWPDSRVIWEEGTHYAMLFEALAGQSHANAAFVLQNYVNNASKDIVNRAFAFYVLSKYDTTKLRSYAKLLLADGSGCPVFARFLIAAGLLEGKCAAEGAELWRSIADANLLEVGKTSPARMGHGENSCLNSRARNMALVLHLLQELPFPDRQGKILAMEGEFLEMMAGLDKNNAMTTQEHAWSTIAFAEMLARHSSAYGENGKMRLGGSVKGAGKSAELNEKSPEFHCSGIGKYHVANTGNTPLFIRRDYRRMPVAEDAARANGISIRRVYLDKNGKPASSFKVGDLVKVEIALSISQPCSDVVVCDLLPANFEIEDERFVTRAGMEGSENEPYDSMARQTNLEKRFDRALWFGSFYCQGEYVFSYSIRAVAPGVSAVPAVQAEAMYSPSINAINIYGNEKLVID